MIGWVLIGLIVLAVALYLRQISRSRSYMERLHQPPPDLRRADDNQSPAEDGSAGFV